ncbi:MAG: hypothetical protein ACTSQI_07875 [Candidatus Helarchaeota archaeon]
MTETTPKELDEKAEIRQLREDIIKLKYVIVILLSFSALEFGIILWLL